MLERWEGIVSEEEDRNKEKEAIKDALIVCGHPDSIMSSVTEKMDKKSTRGDANQNDKGQERNRGMVVLPHIWLLVKVSQIPKRRSVVTEMTRHTTNLGKKMHLYDDLLCPVSGTHWV